MANRNTDAVPELLVEARGLSRTFGSRTAVDTVELSVASGECLAIFGPNGAGKTTLLRLLAGLLRPTAGQARIAGTRSSSRAPGCSRAALIGHPTMLYEALTPRENLMFAAALYGIHDADQAVMSALQSVGAKAFCDIPIRSLSRGMQQRVTVARALLPRPDVLLADEPFTALDDEGVTAVRTEFGRLLARGGAIVLVTHDVANATSISTRSATMTGGRLRNA